MGEVMGTVVWVCPLEMGAGVLANGRFLSHKILLLLTARVLPPSSALSARGSDDEGARLAQHATADAGRLTGSQRWQLLREWLNNAGSRPADL
jgi:hypothetical protein